MGMFDDLVPSGSATAPQKSGGMFDDLVPEKPKDTRSIEERYAQDRGGDLNQDEKRTFIQGVTSYGDEIMGAMSAIPDYVRGDAGFWDAYAKHVNEQREGLERYKKFDPSGASNTEIGGMVTSMVGPGAIFKGARALGLGLKGALTAAGASGGLHYGSGKGDPDPNASIGESIAERAKSAVVPTAAGAVAAPVLGAAGEKIIGLMASAIGKAYSAVARPENGAYEYFLKLLGGPEALDRFASNLATGSGKSAEDVQRRTFDILGEEMTKAGGNVKAATQAAIQRIQSEFNVAESTAKSNLTNLRGANRDSDLFMAEYPAVAEANAATRKRKTATPEEIGRMEDTPIQGVYDDLAQSGGTKSVAATTNALMNRANNAGANMTERIQSFAPRVDPKNAKSAPQTIEDVDAMISGLKGDAGKIYDNLYAPNSNLVDNAVLQAELRKVVDKHIDEWAGRGGDYKDALDDAIREFYFKTPTGQTILMPTLKMTQDMRGALRGKMEKAPQHIKRVLQPMYQDVTAAMTKASPEWAKANAKYAEGAVSEKVSELADAFSLKAGPKYREQLAEYKALDPKFKDVVKVHFLRKIEDLLHNTKNSHDISKFFDNHHIPRSIGEIFGPDAAKQWARIVRDAKVATKSKNMLGNSKTPSRLARQENASSDDQLVAAVQNVSDPRNWLIRKVSEFTSERKNRALANIATTPVSDVARTAEHVANMRQVPERLKKYDRLPTKYGERMGKPAGFIGSRATAEDKEMPDRPRYNWKPQSRASGGEVLPEPDLGGRGTSTIPSFKDLSNQDLYDQFPDFFPNRPEKNQQQEYIRKRMQEGVPGTDALYEWYKMQEQNKRPGFDAGGGVLDDDYFYEMDIPREKSFMDILGESEPADPYPVESFGSLKPRKTLPSEDAGYEFRRIGGDKLGNMVEGVASFTGADQLAKIADSDRYGEPGPQDYAALAAPAIFAGAGLAGRALSKGVSTLAEHPYAATAVGAGLGLTTPSIAEAPGDESAKALNELRAARKSLDEQRKAAIAERDSQVKGDPKRNIKAGRGDNYSATLKELERLDTQILNMDRQIEREMNKTDPDYVREQAEKDRLREEQIKREEMDKPFVERVGYGIPEALTAASYVAPGLLARYGLGKIASKGDDLVANVKKFRGENDLGSMAETVAELNEWQKKLRGRQAMAVGIPATIPLDLQAAKDVWDRETLPPSSKAQQTAEKKLSDYGQYVKDHQSALVTGAVSAGVGAKLAQTAPRDGAKSLMNLYGTKDGPWWAKPVMPRRPQSPAELEKTLGSAVDASRRAQDRVRRAEGRPLPSTPATLGEAPTAAAPTPPAATLGQTPQRSLPPALPKATGTPGPQTPARPEPKIPANLGTSSSRNTPPVANVNMPSKKAKAKELPYYKIKTRDGRELHRARGTEQWHPNPQKAKASKPAPISRVNKAVQTPKDPKIAAEVPSTPAMPDLGKTFTAERSAILGGNVDGVVAKIADDTGMEPSAVRRELMRWLDDQG